MKHIKDFELYQDNAGNYHLFAMHDGKPFAGFCSAQSADVIVAIYSATDGPEVAEDPQDWEGQYGDDQTEEKRHTIDDITSAYNEITGWVLDARGGARELDIGEFLLEEEP